MLRKLLLERLEPRMMLSSTAWTGASGSWNDASKWSNGVPTAATSVTITNSSVTITIPSGTVASAASITLPAGDTLVLPNASGGNQVGNVGFESPTASGSTTSPDTWWNYGSAYVSTQYAYTGLQSLEVYGNSSGAGQSFDVTPGLSYSASVYAMTPAGNQLSGSIGAAMQLLFYDANGNLLSSYSPPNSITVGTSSSSAGGPLAGSVGSQGWNFFSTTVVAPSKAATASLILGTYAPNSSYSGAEFFDDAELVVGTTLPVQLSVGGITNQGTLNIGAGDSVVDSGTFSQPSSGKLEIQLAGAPSTSLYGGLTVSGSASLAGTLQVAQSGSYVPATTDSFIPITYASQSGSFTSEILPSGGGYQMFAATTFTNIAISAAPTSAVTTNVGTTTDLHAAATDMLGINATYWDNSVDTAQTEQMLSDAGVQLVRFPGGSASDDFHFNVSNNYGDSSGTTIPEFAEMIAAEGGIGIVTVDYGSGSPQEAAAELAYLEGSTSNNASMGSGIEWNDSTGQWQTVNWNTVGYWASLRAASPLAHDDGLNFLRIDHPAPFTSINYWEIGNEEYGSWEVDHHGTALPGGGSTGAPHDPTTYAEFAEQFASIIATTKLPTVNIGIDSGDPTGASDGNWTRDVLAAGKSIGFIPGFISDHSYMQAPGDENDSFLLNDTVSASGSLDNWSVRYADYESLLSQTVGSQAGVQVLATEFNSVYTDPGKQGTSLVNGLFIANSLGSLLDSGYAGSAVWDLRNGPDSGENNSNSLYGWREIGDYGVLGDGGSPPSSGTYVAYPSYFALELVSKFLTSGGEVVSATSSYSDLDTYALMQPDGDLELLVINTNPAAAITSQFDLTGFQPSGAVQVWQYGETQDTAQSQSGSGTAALANSNGTLTLSGANFDYAFPSYSMTVFDVKQSPTVASAAAATVGSSGKSASLSALGSYNSTAGSLTYTWSTVGTPPAAVTFSSNGSSTSNNSTATFSKAGTYTLEVTITSPAGTLTTSSAVVTVPQKLTSISLGLASSNLSTTGTQQFSGTALDQFGNALTTQPTIAWSVPTGPGTINGSGQFTPPYVAGSSTIEATSGGVDATEAVTLPGPAVWGPTGGGSWNSSANWQSSSLGGNVVPPGTRGNIGDDAELESGSGTVTLDGDQPILAALTISSTSGYTIGAGSGGTLQMDSGTENGSIAVLAGNNAISANIDLLSNTTITEAQNSLLTISGSISGTTTLTIAGSGTVAFAGTKAFAGNIIVNTALDVENGALISNSLSIGNNSTVTIEPSGSGSNTASSTTSASAAAESDNPLIVARRAEIPARIAARAAQLTAKDEQSAATILPVPSVGPPAAAVASSTPIEQSATGRPSPKMDSTVAPTTDSRKWFGLEIAVGIASPEAHFDAMRAVPLPLIPESKTGVAIESYHRDALIDNVAETSDPPRLIRAGADDSSGDASPPIAISDDEVVETWF